MNKFGFARIALLSVGAWVWGCGDKVADLPTNDGYTGGDSLQALDGGGDYLVSGDTQGDAGGDTHIAGDDQIGGDTHSPADCDVTICLGGALFRNTGANPSYVQPLCETLPGIIYDSTYSFFMYNNSDGALAALIDALDTDDNGFVDQADDACRVHIVGYSWGGVNAAEKLAPDFIGHANVAADRSFVDTLLIMAPYAPAHPSPIHVPDRVRRFREYRHSVTPSGDCSDGPLVPGGPYMGIAPECPTGADCIDYDYSLEPDSLFVGLVSEWYGDEVGHCTVVDVAAPAVMYELGVTATVAVLPPTVAVSRY